MTQKTNSQVETKTEGIYKRLRSLAFEKGPNAQLPTIRILCDELSTTRVTLGEVLNTLEAENILYRKERQGIFVSPDIYHKSIYILFNSRHLGGIMMSPFWNMLWVSLEQKVQQRSTHINEHCSMYLIPPQFDINPPYSHPIMSMIHAGRVDGILSVGVDMPVDGIIADQTIPCISFACAGSSIVQMDGHEIGLQATRTLLQQGCQRIGFWTPHTSDLSCLNEVHGLRRALAEQHVELYPELLRAITAPLPDSTNARHIVTQEIGYMFVHDFFRQPAHLRPDGIFINDDLMTDGALVAFDELNITIGKDIQIVTAANVSSPILFGRTKNMTVFEYDVNEIVNAMFFMLDSLMNGQTPTHPIAWIRPHLRTS